MRIAGKEFLKLIRHPMLWCLTAVFFFYNILFLYGDIGHQNARDYFHSLHDIILAYGVSLDEPNPDFDREEPMAAFYLDCVERARFLYDGLDMDSLLALKQERYHYYPTGAYEKFLRSNYAKLQKRLEEIKAAGETDYGFYPGTAGGVHSLLYGKLMRKLMPETALLLMLSLLYLMDYERIQKTRPMVLSTRTGKGVIRQKLLAGMGAGLLFDAFLAAGSFGAFFYCIPFQGLWEVPMSASLMAEARLYDLYPFITFRPLTVGSYFALYLSVLTLLLLVMGLLTAGIWLLVQNGYLTFLIQILLYTVLYLAVPGGFTSFLDVLVCLNPCALWISSTCWFMENELILSFAWNELWCAGLWGVIAALVLLCGARRYRKLELR